jgi:predicted ATPase
MVEALKARARQPPLQVRLGIHTGLVVIGEIGSSDKREMLALGETPNIAARIQGQANPDEVMISAATYHLVEGLFDTDERGQPELKGAGTPLTLYCVEKESEAHSRFEVVVRKGLTPLIGREHEFGLLRERWKRVKEGAGQVMLLSGEPGIGKSRLVEALKAEVEPEGARLLELRCSPYAQNSALQPVIEYLQRTLQFRPEDAADEKLQKLIVGATGRVPPQTEKISLLAALLSLPHPRDCPTVTLSLQKQKEKTHEALVAWLCAEAKHQAVAYAWEDLQWADPSTLELLTLLLQQVPTTRLLTVLTFRPEFMPPWGAPSYLSQLTLSRLGRHHVETMVEKVTGGKPLPGEVIRQIVSKTDGVPLFVEELTKSVVEAVGAYGRAPLQVLEIPSTLQDSLMARLDRLGAAKEIAQLGAILGREFPYELLKAVSPLNEEILQRRLQQLVASELVYQSDMPPQARYLFKHALVQDTAYQSLLKSRRQHLHQQVAQVLTEQFPETVETQPELVAHHYTEAGLIAQAIPYWQQAGQKATQRSANAEAISHLTKGLKLLKALPDTPEHVQQELALQVALVGPLTATKGYAAPEVEKIYTRARELCRQLGETPHLFQVLLGLFSFHIVRMECNTARELAEQCLTLAQSVQDEELLIEAHRALGQCLYLLGELVSAREHLERSIAFYGPHPRHAAAFYWNDPGVVSYSWEALTLWLLGYPDQALQRAHEAVTLAQKLSNAYTLAIALGRTAMLHHFRQERAAMQTRAEETITLATEHGFPFFSMQSAVLKGWTQAQQGQTEGGIAQMRQGVTALRGMGVESTRPYHLALLAEAYGKAGQAAEGLTLVAEALDLVTTTGERFYEAELYRLKGMLTLQSQTSLDQVSNKPQASQDRSEDSNPRSLTPDHQGEAEECFWEAIEIACQQQAKSWELRASTSLTCLWQSQGKKTEAHKLLSDVYNWFTEGFATKDLQEAKALLEQLS